jgi:hypothetical protein
MAPLVSEQRDTESPGAESARPWRAIEALVLPQPRRFRPLINKQHMQVRLADMLRQITLGQLLALQLGRLKDAGTMHHTQVSLAKWNNLRMAIDVARECRDILGAGGISVETSPVRHMLNLESLITYEGTETIHQLIVGKEMGSRGGLAAKRVFHDAYHHATGVGRREPGAHRHGVTPGEVERLLFPSFADEVRGARLALADGRRHLLVSPPARQERPGASRRAPYGQSVVCIGNRLDRKRILGSVPKGKKHVSGTPTTQRTFFRSGNLDVVILRPEVGLRSAPSLRNDS